MFLAALQNAIAPTRPIGWIEAIMLSTAALFAVVPLTVGVYLVKSAIGINLMAGPSPLHDLFYHLAV